MNCKSCRKRKVRKPQAAEYHDSKVLLYDSVLANID